MTIQLELFVAGISVVRDIWHDPPPCTAEPMNQSGCGAPIAISVTIAPALLVALHGKLEPSATKGLLSGLPYGGGLPRIIWALVVATKRPRAEKERIDMIEDILCDLIFVAVLRSRRSEISEIEILGFVDFLGGRTVEDGVDCEERR